jgi:ribosome-associated protein
MTARPDDTTRDVRLAPGVRVPRAALRFSFVASGGPGGQNVNRRSTKAVLRVGLDAIGLDDPGRGRLRKLASHLVTKDGEIVISADSNRSQHRNRAECLDLLRALVLQAAEKPKTRRATKPTRGSIERRLDAKKRRSSIKSQRRRPPE